MDEKRSLFCTLPAAHSGPCQPEKPADPDDARAESVAALRAEVESLRAENDALNHEIMGYQVDDGYQKGYDHAQAAAASEILRTRADLAAVRTDLSVARRQLSEHEARDRQARLEEG